MTDDCRLPTADCRLPTADCRLTTDRLMNLLVGIDTEGDNQWDAAARTQQTFENLYALPRLHALFARHGVQANLRHHSPCGDGPEIGRSAADVARRG